MQGAPPASPGKSIAFEAAKCNPVGIWRIEDARTGAAGGVCAVKGFEGGASNVLITTTGRLNQIRWEEETDTELALIRPDDCSIVVTTKKKKSFPAGDGGAEPYELTMKIERRIRFLGRELEGSATAEISTDPPLKGTPCQASYAVKGKHL